MFELESIEDIRKSARELHAQFPGAWVRTVRNQLQFAVISIDDRVAFTPLKLLVHAAEGHDPSEPRDLSSPQGLRLLKDTLTANGFTELSADHPNAEAIFRAYLRYYGSFKTRMPENWDKTRRKYFDSRQMRFMVSDT